MAEKLKKISIYPKVGFLDISKAFWNGVKSYRWSLTAIILVVTVLNVISAVIPLFYKHFFDVITSNSDRTSLAGQLLIIIVYIAILNSIFWLLFRLHSYFNIRYQARVIALLKQQAYDYLMQHDYSFFTNHFTGSLVQKVNRFGKAFERMSDRILWDMLSLLIKTLSIITVVSFINGWIAAIILAWAVIFVLFNVLFSIWKIKYDIALAEIDSKTTGYLADTITNQNTVHLFNGFAAESRGYRVVTDEQAEITRFNWNLTAIIEAGQSLLGFAIEFVVFYFTIRYWKDGLVTVGFFVLLQAYIFSLLDQLWGFTRMVRDVYQSYADAKEMVEIMKLPYGITDIPSAKELVVTKGEIAFKNLSFNFNETRTVLKKINLTIKAGEKIALIGPSGAGKTTLSRLVLRLYDPTAGEITIDGQNISKVTQDSLHRNISLVPQDPVLFHRTLAENIAYGRPSAKMKDITLAAKMAHCDEFISHLPQKFHTFVGERGIKLSGGERQRVAIARAILKNAPILILDEATSSLDSHSEALIQDALATLMQNKTVIVIAHRLSTIQKMDRIVVVDEGRILEEGAHAELLSREGSLYRKLWELQAGGFMKDEEEE